MKYRNVWGRSLSRCESKIEVHQHNLNSTCCRNQQANTNWAFLRTPVPMSLSYLESLLPLDRGVEAQESQTTDSADTPLQDISDHELGVLTARFELFAEAIKPFRARLAPIESFLESFNTEICGLSDTLYSLQEKSSQLNSGLDHQRDLVDKLNPIILDLMVPPSVADSVINDPVTEKWVENVRFISEKQQLINRINSDDNSLANYIYKDLTAFKELAKAIDLLEAKAIERIRDFLILQIRLLRRSLKTSSQVVQEKLLQVKELYAFLEERHPALAKQLHLAYIYTMKWYYTTRFAKYLYALQKLRLKVVDLLFVLGGSNDHLDAKLGLFGFVEASYAATLMATTGSPTAPSNKLTLAEYFLSATKRMEILERDGDSRRSIPSQIAETTPFAYWLEFPFNQWSNAVLDNIIVEYLFVTEFFYQGNEKFEPVSNLDSSAAGLPQSSKDWSYVMFDDIYKMGQAYVNWLVTSLHQRLSQRIVSSGTSTAGSSYGSAASAHNAPCDAYAILLMIRLIQNQSYTLHNEFHVPVMDEYHNSLLLLLWPHFTKIIDINCESMKKHILGSSSYSHRTSEINQAPINTTQQFAQYMTGLLKLAFVHDKESNKLTYFQGEPVCMSLVRLRNDFESALTKASSHVFGSSKSKAVQKEIFLFNNYFLVVTILRNEFDVDSANAFVKEQIKHFELLCDAYKPK